MFNAANQPSVSYALIINGQKWEVWKEIRLTRSIERMSAEFQVGLTQKPEEGFLSSAIHAGLPVQVEINGETVLDGYIDNASHSYNERDARIAIAGRDKTGDLIDCAASVDGPFEFNNHKLEKVIEKIIKPYGINLVVEADTGAAFKRIAIQPGETAYEFIERICRYRAVLPISNGIGGLVLVKPGTDKSPGRLIYGQNIKSGQVSNDWSKRHSLYVVKGQAEGYDETTASEVSSGEGRARDELVTRYRPTVITAESQGFNQTLQERARWQRNVARARANTASYDVVTWYADPDAQILWKPNTLVQVIDPARTISREMLIVSTSFSRDNLGTISTLDLAIPEAYELQAEKEPDSDDILGEG